MSKRPKTILRPRREPENAEAPTVLVSDSMYLSLSGQNEPESETAPRLFSTRSAAPAVTLSDDNQWLVGMEATMEYITKDTYDAQKLRGCR